MEVWKDVLDYEFFYEVSNLGNIRTKESAFKLPNGGYRRQRILKTSFAGKGYCRVKLYDGVNKKSHSVHRLVWESFNGKTDLQIDHIIEGNKLDNRLCNLQIVDNRQNQTKRFDKTKTYSQYTGVTWQYGKWVAQIKNNNTYRYLGRYTNEIDAHNAYQKALSSL